jgi:hypothetical protein
METTRPESVTQRIVVRSDGRNLALDTHEA